MITTRERIKLSELFQGMLQTNGSNHPIGLNHLLPLHKRYHVFTNQGKTAFEQIVISAKLENSRILLPAFIPNDFVGIFHKYNITPVFIDVDPETYHLNLEAINEKQLEGAKALLLLHTFGLPANGKEYRSYCERHGLIMIEDCARALGASVENNLVGAFGHYALFSFPKCTPARQGGIALSENQIDPVLKKAKISFSGLLHTLTLVKFPFLSMIETPIYRLFADTSVYPREVGIFNPLPGRDLDDLSKFVLKSYIPSYHRAVAKKRSIASILKKGLEPIGFKFQKDNGNHIFTSLSAEPPSNCDVNELKRFLVKNGVKMSAMWRNALGVSRLSQQQWNTKPHQSPVALHLSKRLLQFPVSRFQTPNQTNKIIKLCRLFLGKKYN
jgi:dTDP-4-amino-4,6-dideoxygalactose transaminase